MDTPTDTSDCDAESGFIFPHKQRQTHPPLKKNTQNAQQNNNINSTQIETKKKLTEKHPKEKKFNPTLFRESLFFPNTT